MRGHGVDVDLICLLSFCLLFSVSYARDRVFEEAWGWICKQGKEMVEIVGNWKETDF
jgi:hypothetical protein